MGKFLVSTQPFSAPNYKSKWVWYIWLENVLVFLHFSTVLLLTPLSLLVKCVSQPSRMTFDPVLFVCLTDWTTLIRGMLLLWVGLWQTLYIIDTIAMALLQKYAEENHWNSNWGNVRQQFPWNQHYTFKLAFIDKFSPSIIIGHSGSINVLAR